MVKFVLTNKQTSVAMYFPKLNLSQLFHIFHYCHKAMCHLALHHPPQNYFKYYINRNHFINEGMSWFINGSNTAQSMIRVMWIKCKKMS